MQKLEIPANESDRLIALQRYQILDTLPEQEYDDLTQLAADICGTPVALFSFVDRDRLWFKSSVGMDGKETPRDISFCNHVVANDKILNVPDTSKDPRFADHPLVVNHPNIRFYTGVPLRTSDNFVLGSLCVIDFQPKELTSQQIKQLEALSRLAIGQLELRRVNAQTSLQASALECSYDAIITKTLDGRITSWNYAAERMFGYTEAEAIGQPMVMLFPSERLEEENQILGSIRQGERIEHFETVHIRKDGTRLDVSATISPIKDTFGKIVGISKIVRDITDFKKSQKQLRDITGALDQTAIVSITDDLGNITIVNDQFCQISKYSREELIGQNHRLLNSGYHPPQFFVDMWKTITNGQTWRGDIKNRAKDGSFYWVDTTIAPLLDERSKSYQYPAICKDITASKEAYIESQMLSLIARHTDNTAIVTDAKGFIEWVNNGYVRLTGYTLEESIGKRLGDILQGAKTSQETIARIRKALALHEPFSDEILNYTKDGKPFWISMDIQPVFDENKKLVNWIAIEHDITTRKEIEAHLRHETARALEKSENLSCRLELAIKSAQIGIWEWDIQQNSLIWDKRMYELYGLSQENIQVTYDIWANRVHRDDFAASETLLQQAALGKAEYDTEFRAVHPNGSIHYIKATGMLTHDTEVNPQSMIGVHYDITDRKLAEQLLKQQADRDRLFGTITQRMRSTLSLDEILNTTVTELHKFLQSDRVLVYRLFPDGTGSAISESVSEPWDKILNIVFPEEVFPQTNYDRYIQGRIFALSDREASPQEVLPCLAEFLAQIQVRAILTAPIVFNDSLWGLLIAHQCDRPRQWHWWEINMFEQVTSQLTIAIQQVNLFEQLQQELRDRQYAELLLSELNQQLMESNEELARATRFKDEFLANMSHEIRTPMNAVIGMTHLALKTDLNPRQSEYLRKIQTASKHLLGIINDILDFSKIEAGKLTIEQIDFELAKVLENVATLIAEKASAKGLELLFDIDRDLPRNFIGDPLRLGQILTNYANNAIKFTQKGEITIIVRLKEYREEKIVLYMAVKDTGIGLKEEQISLLFKSFQQADSSTTRKFGGTGLGLAICKRIVELMEGEVGVESEFGKGSTFWSTVCLSKSTAPPRRTIFSNEIEGKFVLVVDDNENARLILKDLLEEMKFQVDMADSGKAALNAITAADEKGSPYEIIFLDWKMPDMDGLEVARQIKMLPLKLKPYHLLVTAYEREEVFRAVKSGESFDIDHVLIKPVNASAVFDSLARVLGDALNQTATTSSIPSVLGDRLKAIRGSKLLLVEDNELNQEVAIGLLQDAGFVVDLAENGRIAVEKVKNNDYALVLMDMQMPEMDGVAATIEIRKDPHYQSLPIVAMTANVMQGDRDKCFASGMNEHIAKPIEPDELWKTLLNWIAPNPDNDDIPEISLLASSKESESITIPSNIAGLNTSEGLRRVLNKKSLYLSMLRKFVAGQKNFAEQLNQALKASDFHLAERLAHTLKGVAGNIGAEVIEKAAAALETGIKNEASRSEMELLLIAVRRLLKSLIEALNSQLPPEVVSIDIASIDWTHFEQVCHQLSELLIENDAEAVDFFQDHANLLRSAFPNNYKAIATGVNTFDFDTAHAALTLAIKTQKKVM